MPQAIEKIELKGISKSFGGVLANDEVCLSVKSGEVVALLGENGAGKTTLMNILYGLYTPDCGGIFINGKRVEIDSPARAMELGIGMVHQHFKLIPNHTVAENIALGFAGAPFFRPAAYLAEKIKKFSAEYGLQADPFEKPENLSAGQQQKVEIIKTLLRGANLIILDEPTSVLSPPEVRELFVVLKKLAASGKSIIFISHKLDEIIEISNRVEVLRKGKNAGSVETASADRASLANMMVGHELAPLNVSPDGEFGPELLRLEDLTVENERGAECVRRVSLCLRKGEILGIAGVSGNGQNYLAQAICGMRPVKSGKISVRGKEFKWENAKSAAQQGIAHIPEDRIHDGIAGGLSVAENAVLTLYYRKPFSERMLINSWEVQSFAEKIIERYEVNILYPGVAARALSGGNIQKLLAGRELESGGDIVVAAHPTYGLDAGACRDIRGALLKKRDEGSGVLLISEDLDEIFEIADTVAVMFRGELMSVLPRASAERDAVGLMMAGVRPCLK